MLNIQPALIIKSGKCMVMMKYLFNSYKKPYILMKFVIFRRVYTFAKFTDSIIKFIMLNNIFSLSKQELKRGVTAVSAGNHAIATAFAAKIMGTNSKVVMVKNANPFRVQQCQSFNAEIVFADNIHHAFDIVKKIETQEGRTFIHPFEGHLTALGTATLGFEFANQVKNLDALIIPIGGGGLCAGVASAFKLIQPKCYIYGVIY